MRQRAKAVNGVLQLQNEVVVSVGLVLGVCGVVVGFLPLGTPSQLDGVKLILGGLQQLSQTVDANRVGLSQLQGAVGRSLGHSNGAVVSVNLCNPLLIALAIGSVQAVLSRGQTGFESLDGVVQILSGAVVATELQIGSGSFFLGQVLVPVVSTDDAYNGVTTIAASSLCLLQSVDLSLNGRVLLIQSDFQFCQLVNDGNEVLLIVVFTRDK